MILTIAKLEFRRMFYSPLAWVILAIVEFVLALIFLSTLQNYIQTVEPQLTGITGAPGVTQMVISPLFMWSGIIMLAVTPLITMRSFSEEFQNHTLPLLMTSPTSITQIVIGKYLGLLSFMLLMIGIVILMPLSLSVGTHLDWGHLAAAALGLMLLLASFSAAGLYLSSLTEQPTLAAISTFGFLLFLVVLYISGTAQNTASQLFIYLSQFSHFLSFLRGEFQSSDLAYFLIFILTFLVLTIRQIDGLRLPH